jgi:putative hemolysin
MDELPLLLFLLILSGFFSGLEIALFSLGAERIKALKKEEKNPKKKRKIEELERLKSDSNKLLVTILIGNNIANIAASSMATVVALELAVTIGWDNDVNTVIALVTGVMTLMILIFGEITPKALAHRYALPFAIFCTPVIKFLQTILYPIIMPISTLTKKFTGNHETKHGLTELELKAAIELSEQEGQINSNEKKLFDKVLEFSEHTVEDIMTPRSKVFALPDNTPVEDAVDAIAEAPYSRIPIYHDDLDEVVGVLKVQSIVQEIRKIDFWEKNVANLSLLPPFKIPLTMKIDTLLREFQAEKHHMAFVYDEHGGLIGLITLEDIIEEVFGEFEDEVDEDEINMRRTGKFSFLFSAEAELEQVEKFIRTELLEKSPEHFPWEWQEENNTLAYFMLEKLEHFPKPNEKISVTTDKKTYTFTITKCDDDRIEEIEMMIGKK